jgi:dTDP-4-dehydrorhamnose 3,5-epimerase
MKIFDCPIEGLKIIQLELLRDERGFFVERYNAALLAEAGLPASFAQDNHSRSVPGVARGMHYHHTPALGKLIGVTRGRVWDVALDIRPHSPSFGQHHAVELSEGMLYWMPAGFAHGFCVLGDEPADVVYKVTGTYNRDGEGGIAPYDPDLGIDWPVKNPVLSQRDQNLPSWAHYAANPINWQGA